MLNCPVSGDQLCFSVKDFGVGISKSVRLSLDGANVVAGLDSTLTAF